VSIFNLHTNVLADYRDFVRSFFSVADDRAREFIERELVAEARLWPEALPKSARPTPALHRLTNWPIVASSCRKRRRFSVPTGVRPLRYLS
jgi:hypothetical protein